MYIILYLIVFFFKSYDVILGRGFLFLFVFGGFFFQQDSQEGSESDGKHFISVGTYGKRNVGKTNMSYILLTLLFIIHAC